MKVGKHAYDRHADKSVFSDLQSIKAEAGIRLALGLKIEDFIALAQSDSRLKGVPSKLLRIFLEELTVQGGFMAAASFSAMAYAKVGLTGCPISKNNQKSLRGAASRLTSFTVNFREPANIGSVSAQCRLSIAALSRLQQLRVVGDLLEPQAVGGTLQAHDVQTVGFPTSEPPEDDDPIA